MQGSRHSDTCGRLSNASQSGGRSIPGDVFAVGSAIASEECATIFYTCFSGVHRELEAVKTVLVDLQAESAILASSFFAFDFANTMLERKSDVLCCFALLLWLILLSVD